MTPVKEPINGPYVVMAAWYCKACDVAGRDKADAEVTCWNCNGQVVVTAQPSVPIGSI